MSKKEHKSSKMRSLFKGFRKSTTDLSEWSKSDEKLMKAVEAGEVAKIDNLLVKKSLNPTKLGPKGLSVFHMACMHGQLQVVELLITHGAEVNVLSIQGNTSVQLAARDGWLKVLEKLIEAGGVIDHKDGLSLTALHHSCVRGQINCVQVLLKHGADPNSRDKTGKPPIFYAAFAANLPICKELLDRGANVNAHDDQQLTALMAASKKGSAEVCEFLLKKGADPNFCDLQGHDALSYGLDAGFTNLREVFSKAPTRASWDVVQPDNTSNSNVPSVSVDAPSDSEPPVDYSSEENLDAVDQENLVAKFVPEQVTPETVHRQPPKNSSRENAEVIQILADKKSKDDLDEEALAERAASPPQAVIDQRALEAYKELEEENEHMNEDLRNLTAQHKRLQEAYDALKKQLSTPAPPPVDQEEVQELEDELSALKSQLTEEQDKNVRLIDRVKKMKRQSKGESENDQDSGEDSWNDSDDELFDSPSTRKTAVVVDHKPQTLLLLQNQVAQLRQDNKHLRERLHDKTGSMSSLASLDDGLEVDRLRRRLEEVDQEKLKLKQQVEVNNVFPEEMQQNLMVIEQENTQLHSEVKQLRTEINLLKLSKDNNKPIPLLNGDLIGEESNTSKGLDSSESAIESDKLVKLGSENPPANESLQEVDDIRKENDALRTENSLLTEELENLRDTYNKLVIAGDNLQDMYDQLVLDKEQVHEELENLVKAKQELAKENEYLLADGNAMHDDIERLVQEVEKVHEQHQNVQTEKEEIERKLNAMNQVGKASEFARLVEERDKLQERVTELEKVSEELKQNHDVVLEEVQSLQVGLKRVEYERDQLQQEFDSLQDEFENVQGSQEGLQQDYSQLEQDYSDLLADKEKLEQEFLDVQTASVNVEHHNPALTAERDNLQQENEVLAMEKEQLEMTTKELSKSNALLQEELISLKDALKLNENSDNKDLSEKESSDLESKSGPKQINDKAMADAVVEKDRRIRSLQIQISRLQQQLAEADRHFRDVINTYRTHLLSAVQGHMDPDVKQALYNIIELRSMEQFC